MFIYFAIMEFLQLAQYSVAGQCDSRINQALTWAAYIHVAFQPLVVNFYFLWGQRNPHPEVGSFVMKLCLAAAVLMLMRTPVLPLALLGDWLHTYFPDIPTSDTYGKHCHYLEAFCGERACSFKGGAWGHISWSIPLAPTTYFLPSSFIHFFMFFVPTLTAGDNVKRLLMIATVFIGPLACMAIAAQDMSTYVFEWATIWCFFAAVQSFWAILVELYFYKKRFIAADAEEMAQVGKWAKHSRVNAAAAAGMAAAGGKQGAPTVTAAVCVTASSRKLD